MSKSFNTLLAGVIASTALLAAAPAMAVSVVGATKLRVTSAIPTWLQIAEVEAIEFGTGDNVASFALGGVASASSQYDGISGPGKANDGNTNGNYYAGEIFHSGGPGGNQFLDIVLGRAASLANLRIYGNTDGFAERNFYTISVFNAANDVLYSGAFDSRVTRLSFVDFDAPPQIGGIPEPATWAMMIIGFGAVGSAMRSRRRALA